MVYWSLFPGSWAIHQEPAQFLDILHFDPCDWPLLQSSSLTAVYRPRCCYFLDVRGIRGSQAGERSFPRGSVYETVWLRVTWRPADRVKPHRRETCLLMSRQFKIAYVPNPKVSHSPHCFKGQLKIIIFNFYLLFSVVLSFFNRWGRGVFLPLSQTSIHCSMHKSIKCIVTWLYKHSFSSCKYILLYMKSLSLQLGRCFHCVSHDTLHWKSAMRAVSVNALLK